MSSNSGAAAGGFVFLLTILASIGSGVLAWNWVEPKSFFGALVFLFAWGILSYIAHMLLAGIAVLLFSND